MKKIIFLLLIVAAKTALATPCLVQSDEYLTSYPTGDFSLLIGGYPIYSFTDAVDPANGCTRIYLSEGTFTEEEVLNSHDIEIFGFKCPLDPSELGTGYPYETSCSPGAPTYNAHPTVGNYNTVMKGNIPGDTILKFFGNYNFLVRDINFYCPTESLSNSIGECIFSNQNNSLTLIDNYFQPDSMGDQASDSSIAIYANRTSQVTMQGNTIQNFNSRDSITKFFQNDNMDSTDDKYLFNNSEQSSMHLYKPGTTIFENLTMTGNKETGGASSAVDAGAMSINEQKTSSSFVTIRNSLFNVNSTGYQNAGAITCYDCGLNLDVGTTFAANTGIDGGAIRVLGFDTKFNAFQTLFLGNNAQSGGAVYISGDMFQKPFFNEINCEFNKADTGGCLTLSGSTTGSLIQNSTFSVNQAYGSGGAILMQYQANTSVSLSSFNDNYAPQGGAAYLLNSQNVLFEATTFEKNKATSGSGGGIYATAGGTTYEFFLNNIYAAENEAVTGGGFLYSDNSAKLNTTNSNFVRNETTGSTPNGRGGAIYLTSYLSEIEGATFRENTAEDGGAIYYTNLYDSNYNHTVKSTLFVDNTTDEDGGAIYQNFWTNSGKSQSLNIEKSLFETNSSSEDGGAIYLWDGVLNLASSVFYSNSSIGHGGAIVSQTTRTATANNVSFLNNQSGGGHQGDTFYFTVNYHTFNIQNSVIEGNVVNGHCFHNSSLPSMPLNSLGFNSYDSTSNTCAVKLKGTEVFGGNSYNSFGGFSSYRPTGGSVVINAGDISTCTTEDLASRARGGSCEIGAAEKN